MIALAETTRAPQSSKSREGSGLGCLVVIARHFGIHLTASELIQRNSLGDGELSSKDIANCATGVGLRAKVLQLDHLGIEHLDKALPAVVGLKNGTWVVLLRLESKGMRVVLQDPNSTQEAPLVIDRLRFQQAWTGEAVLLKRNYDIADERQPFSIRFIVGLIFRERWIVRDVAICAFVLGIMALTPIMFWRLLTDKVIYHKAFNTFSVLSVTMAVFIVFEAVFAWLRQFLVLFLTSRIDAKLLTHIFEKVLNLPMDFFERTQVGTIAYDMSQVWRIRTFLVGHLFGTILDSTTLIFFLPLMFFFSPAMTAVVLAICVLIVAWLLAMLPNYRQKVASVEQAESDRGAFLAQTLFGMRTVKSLALDARQRQLWDVHVARVTKLRFAEGLTANLIQSVVRPLERLAVSGSFALGAYIAITTNDPVYVGALFAFLMLSQRVTGPLMQIAQLVNQYDEARIAVAVVSRLVNQPEEEGRSGNGLRAKVRGHVEFSNVTFTYKGSTSPVLQDISFEAPEGTMLGIMGRSGSGKTTVARLLQSLHSNYEGLIKIDGVDIREYDIDHLRRNLGVVLQENFLFSGTIRENIIAAKTDATFDEVVQAARLAGAEEFIDKLPRGYETYVYEGSPNISGGQRQRLAIARALIVNPRILILDEATSALDPESESIVASNIARIASGRTLIVISHRLSSLMSANAILVLERGRVSSIGTHDELLERSDVYKELWHQQNRHLTATAPRKDNFGGQSRVA
ncbi:peptidase domain-containing ABC transporter [Mesorhizobium sp. VK9D]|uniref:peptidase domain-containing ABC transporter n=1 Tax=Mesorhizobium australafricanum TaxID=3072311 RepID=UPI002A240693|nr:peptidase domain-containing ABC transporter [Mesorhizobium sp. VK9D]MDX8456003.1 peptidase domain-containing ABC transporter [Mesorhizobium sp. VK9D]